MKNIKKLFNEKKEFIKRKWVLLLLPLLFYVFFTFYDGVVWCVDTPTYIKMTVDREPVYPLFLFLFRALFQGKDKYLLIAVLFQGLLTAYSIFSFTVFFEKEMNLKRHVSIIIEILFFSVSLLSRFAAKRGSMYSNSLLSESITYPLFILFFRYLMEFVYKRNNKPLVVSSFLSFLLISTRKQMLISLLLLVFALLYACILEKKLTYLAKTFLVVLTVIGSNKLLDYGYNVFFHGINHTHTSSNRFLATMVFYCSERDDVNLIKAEDTKELFLSIFDECERRDLLKTKTSGEWYDRAMHFCDNYDLIQLRVMWPMIREYVASNTGLIGNEAEIKVDQYTSSISFSLLPEIWPVVLSTFADNCLLGAMTTIAAAKPVFIPYTYFAFVLYIILLGYSIWKTGMNEFFLFGTVVLLSIVMNIVLVSLVIFPQTRYTIYNMPLFYISAFLLCFQQTNCIINRKD